MTNGVLFKQGEIAEKPQVVQVPFNGSFIEAVQMGQEIYVAVRKVCDELGVDVEGQRKKINGHEVLKATTEMISAVACDGKVREQMFITLDGYVLWLAGIYPSKVKPEIKPALIAYQLESARALREHFITKEQAPQGVIDLPITPEGFMSLSDAEKGIAYFVRLKMEQEAEQKTLQLTERIQADAPKVKAFEEFFMSKTSMSIGDFAKTVSGQYGIGEVGQNRLFEFMRDKGILFVSDGVNVPYQKHIDAGRFEIKLGVPKAIGTEGKQILPRKTLITPKGMMWLTRKLQDDYADWSRQAK